MNINRVRTTNKLFDLEDRTLNFSKQIISFLKTIPVTIINRPLISQCVRSSTSVGANYREANDALGKKDFALRVRICRKEAKETYYWLELIIHTDSQLDQKVRPLLEECNELIKIFSTIVKKVN